MSNEMIFGEVRSLLAQHQNPQQIEWSVWDTLNRLLVKVDEPYLDEVLVPYCLDHMAHWPDDVCRIHTVWWDAFRENREAAALRLVRYYSQHEMSADDIEALVAHPSIVNLRIFNISDNEWTIGERGGRALAARWPTRRRCLTCASCCCITAPRQPGRLWRSRALRT